MSSAESVEPAAMTILETLIATPFAQCYPVGREFSTLTTRHSIYAVRHRLEGLLYIGKSQNPRQRFTGGHKALVWCWLERYQPEDVRIIAYSLNYSQWIQLSLSLENLIIQATEPPFNVKMPMRD
jgi:predicted GIY-YIG superfamily endonuclease